MRFWSIWSMPSYPLSVRLDRTRDWAAMKIASYLPRRIRYWSTMMDLGEATKKSENIPATPLDEVLENLPRPAHVS